MWSASDVWPDGGYVDVLSAVSGFLGVGLHTLNFLQSSLSLIQQEMFKKIALLAHT